VDFLYLEESLVKISLLRNKLSKENGYFLYLTVINKPQKPLAKVAAVLRLAHLFDK
jgi:hypothetical protein